MTVSRETQALLSHYETLLRKWTQRINLVAAPTEDDLWNRHIADSLQLFELADPGPGCWVDMGSGGGLPGLIVAIAARGRTTDFVLIESDSRKCAFLRTALRELGLENARVINERVERVLPLQARYVSARALAPLPKLLSLVLTHLSTSGEAWLMKGRRWRDEVTEARASYAFDLEATPSRTDPEAAILRIGNIRHV